MFKKTYISICILIFLGSCFLRGLPPFSMIQTVFADTEDKWASSHITGSFTNPNNALGANNSVWAGQLNTNSSQTSRWAIENPSTSISGTQTIHVIARKGSNSGTPTIAINLYENGSLVQSITDSTNVTSTTGQTISGTFNASAITNKDNVEIEVVMTAATGNPSTRNSAQIDSIQWVVNLAVNEPPTLSIAQPDGTNDTIIAGATYNITYTLSDTEDTVTAAFYYDSNNSGYDGTAISGPCAAAAEGTSITCSWDTSGVSPGAYYIYGTADDGTNSPVSTYSSGQITISAASISVTITTDGTVAFGTLDSGENRTSLEVSDTQTAENDGNVTVNFNIKTSVPAGWSLGANEGSDTFVLEYSTNGGSDWTTFNTEDVYQSLATNVATSGTQDFDIGFTAPNPSTSATEKTITVTIQAVEP